MARIDTHVHGLLSKSLSFDHREFRKMVAHARSIGLDGFALTEHFHATAFWSIHEALIRLYPYRDGAYEVGDGFRVLSGAELDIAEGGHIGIIGPLAALRLLDERFRPLLSEGEWPRYRDLYRASEGLGLTIIANHMLRPGKMLTKLTMDELATFSALELNGKDHHTPVEEQILAYARRLDKPLVGGSDAHVWAQIGIRATVLPGEASLERLQHALAHKTTHVETHPNPAPIVRVCAMHKRIVKAKVAAAALTRDPSPGRFAQRPMRRAFATAAI